MNRLVVSIVTAVLGGICILLANEAFMNARDLAGIGNFLEDEEDQPRQVHEAQNKKPAILRRAPKPPKRPQMPIDWEKFSSRSDDLPEMTEELARLHEEYFSTLKSVPPARLILAAQMQSMLTKLQMFAKEQVTWKERYGNSRKSFAQLQSAYDDMVKTYEEKLRTAESMATTSQRLALAFSGLSALFIAVSASAAVLNYRETKKKNAQERDRRTRPSRPILRPTAVQ